jgi:hypothetical protein
VGRRRVPFAVEHRHCHQDLADMAVGIRHQHQSVHRHRELNRLHVAFVLGRLRRLERDLQPEVVAADVEPQAGDGEVGQALGLGPIEHLLVVPHVEPIAAHPDLDVVPLAVGRPATPVPEVVEGRDLVSERVEHPVDVPGVLEQRATGGERHVVRALGEAADLRQVGARRPGIGGRRLAEEDRNRVRRGEVGGR